MAPSLSLVSAEISALLPLTFGQTALIALGFSVLYISALCTYRLFFHPLRHIPGPWLAAATQWVETYYECFKSPGGQFMWKYQEWHQKYGPIVRVAPNEVHIQDPTFYETLYSQSRHSDKLKQLSHRFNNEMSTFATAEHSVHRMRRAALNPYFSRRKIAQHAPNVQALMNRLSQRLVDEYVGNDSILNLNNLWGCFTSDIVVGYCLEKAYDFILTPDFRPAFSDAMYDLVEPVHFITQFPWFFKIFKLLPEWIITAISPPMRSVLAFNEEMRQQILRAKAAHASGEKNPDGHESLFKSLLESDLPPDELSTKRLQHEAISVIGAGIETTMFALATCSFHLLANPDILSRLRAELVTAIPTPQYSPDLDTLMQLPYLTCVINEALRFSYGTPQRVPRLSPTPMVYHSATNQTDYVLPVGSIVSMDHYTAAHDPQLFPDPFVFRPERWEGDPRAPDGKPLSRYMVVFGRGTRSCVGMQLAYADLYIGVSTFFRRFECTLFETERDSVDLFSDKFVPRPKSGTKGVRVKVAKILE